MKIFQNEDTMIKVFIHKSCLSFPSWGRKLKKNVLKSIKSTFKSKTIKTIRFFKFCCPMWTEEWTCHYNKAAEESPVATIFLGLKNKTINDVMENLMNWPNCSAHIQSHLHTVPGMGGDGVRQARHTVVAVTQDLNAKTPVLLQTGNEL